MALNIENSPLGEQTRTSIINAAVEIVRAEGWEALSMRKIAAHIDCSATAIYGYFINKNALVAELVKQGFVSLTKAMVKATISDRLPLQQLEEMWIAYGEYARSEKELYKIMFGIGMPSFANHIKLFETSAIAVQIKKVIRISLEIYSDIEERVSAAYYTLWAVAHGLATLSLNCGEVSDLLYREIIVERIRAIGS